MKSRYFGLTGLPASGKGTFKDLLLEELACRRIPGEFRSLSDVLRAEVRFRGLPVDRDVLRAVGHELRQKHGSGVLSRMILDEVAFDLRQGRLTPLLIVDGIRNPGEVQVFRDSLGEDFCLVAVEAPVETIVERIRSRAREGDPVETADLARQLLTAEMGANEPEYGHNIAECIAMADIVVDNSGSLAELRQAAADFVRNQIVPLL